MAAQQREISVSEFFTKNRHLLGFDSPLKALLTAVKEAVDNSLDACEEAGILPEIRVEILPAPGPKQNGNGNGNNGNVGHGNAIGANHGAGKPDSAKPEGRLPQGVRGRQLCA